MPVKSSDNPRQLLFYYLVLSSPPRYQLSSDPNLKVHIHDPHSLSLYGKSMHIVRDVYVNMTSTDGLTDEVRLVLCCFDGKRGITCHQNTWERLKVGFTSDSRETHTANLSASYGAFRGIFQSFTHRLTDMVPVLDLGSCLVWKHTWSQWNQQKQQVWHFLAAEGAKGNKKWQQLKQ